MTDPLRRRLLASTLALPLGQLLPARAAALPFTAEHGALAALEARAHGRLGVAAFAPGGPVLAYRGDERFPMCSTFKVVLCGAVLARAAHDAALLGTRLYYGQRDVVAYSPRSAGHVADGMTVAALCAAALQYSDNTAANALMRLLGGPPAVTAFARTLGDNTFRLDRWETELNTARPGDPRDTTTPLAHARTCARLLLGEALPPAWRAQLRTWMLGNTTGATRIRAGVPAGWQVADKTGSGDYGSTCDAAVLWRTPAQPLTLVIFFTQPQADAHSRSDVLAEAARIVSAAFTPA